MTPSSDLETVQPQLPSKVKPASLFRRLAAMLYDSLLVAGLLMFGTLLVMFLRSYFVDEGMQSVPNMGIAGLVFQAYLLLIIAGFFILFWVRSGRTLGMQAWHLQIEDLHGGPISTRQAFIRLLAVILSVGCAGLGYLWILFDREGCAWHDRISGTRIRWVPRKKK